jgi:membrane protease YdiL (CAAX protease family)
LRTANGRLVFALLYLGVTLTVLEFYYLPPRVEMRLEGLPSGSRVGRISLEAGVTWALMTSALYLLPLLVVKLVHREKLATVGFSLGGFLRHSWIYFGLYLFMVPFIWFAGQRPDFLHTYPFVGEARRDWTTFWMWEASYLLQFFALEAFFRGYLLFTLERKIGWNAIFVLVVPYTMIHYHKPPLEAFGALIAGTVLGALALRLRSFYGGFVLHGLVAVTMDLLGAHKSGLF